MYVSLLANSETAVSLVPWGGGGGQLHYVTPRVLTWSTTDVWSRKMEKWKTV